MSNNTPVVIDAEFVPVRVGTAPHTADLLAVVERWMERSHGVDNEALLVSMPHLDRHAFTNVVKRAIAAAALELMGEIDLAREVAP